jgi:hypothetical protein
MYDTLDSLLLNNSPKSMEMVSQVLSSKLEQLVARDSNGNDTDATNAEESSESKKITNTKPEGAVIEAEKEQAGPTAQG